VRPTHVSYWRELTVIRLVTDLVESVLFLIDLCESVLRDTVRKPRACPPTAECLMFTAREEL
jgi:hypothetical protein